MSEDSSPTAEPPSSPGPVGTTPPTPASRLVQAAFVTEESVYGVILVSGMIIAAGGHGESSWNVFWSVAATVVVFWAAHVYAGTVAHHGLDHGRVVGLRESFGIAVRRSRGLLFSAFLPLLILLLGATRAIPDAFALWTALWAGVVVLGVLGFVAYRRRGAPWPMQIVGSLATAAFGVAMIVLKAVIH